MDIWSASFRRDESLIELKGRARACKICEFLANYLERSGRASNETVSFYRSGSSLKLSLGGPPVLSIYVPPGIEVLSALNTL